MSEVKPATDEYIADIERHCYGNWVDPKPLIARIRQDAAELNDLKFETARLEMECGTLAQVRQLLRLPVDATATATYQAVIDLQAELDRLRAMTRQSEEQPPTCYVADCSDRTCGQDGADHHG